MSEAGRVVAVSAHRGGSEAAPAGTYAAYRAALAAGAEYIEFDVRRTLDETLVACHRPRAGWRHAVAKLSYARLCELAGYEVPRAEEVIRLLAGRAVAHLDLKDTGCAEAVVAQAAGLLGPAGVLATTGDAAAAASLKRLFPAVPVGLTIGGDAARAVRFAARRVREPGLSRLEDAAAAGADWAVLHHRLARPGLLAECRTRGIKTMVWTVNKDRDLARWLATPSVDAVVTDRPCYAIALRRAAPLGELAGVQQRQLPRVAGDQPQLVVGQRLAGGGRAELDQPEHQDPGDAARVVGEPLRRGERIPGLGHFVYRAGDPRAALLLELVRKAVPGAPQLAVADAITAEAQRRALPGPNIDFALATLAQAAGMVRGAGEAVFAIARTAGWIAHALEEYARDAPIRPRSRYTGPPARA